MDQEICRLNLQGKCKRGNKCKYLHSQLNSQVKEFVPLSAKQFVPLIVKNKNIQDNNISKEDKLKDIRDKIGYIWDEVIDNFYCDEPIRVGYDQEMLDLLEEYYKIDGVYPYDENYYMVPKLMKRYLSFGIKPELYEHLPNLFRHAIELGYQFPWKDFKNAILNKNKDTWPHTELFINYISPNGGVNILCESWELGFIDSRLTHAIITIQRTWRLRKIYRREDGSMPYNISELLDEAHDKTCIPEVGIHLKYLTQTKHLEYFMDDTECVELSILRWNRKCLPLYLSTLITRGTYNPKSINGDNFVDLNEFTEGFNIIMNNSRYPIYLETRTAEKYEYKDNLDIGQLISKKEEDIYNKYKDYLTHDDALAKINILIKMYSRGDLLVFRNPTRDVLKFMSMEINEPKDMDSESIYGSLNPVSRSYLNLMSSVPKHVLEVVLKVIPYCVDYYGRDLLNRLMVLDIDSLNDRELAKWSLDIIVEKPKDIAEYYGDFTEKELTLYLKCHYMKGDVRNKIRDVLISILNECKRKIRMKQQIYEYKIWDKPVIVKSVQDDCIV